MQNNPFTKGKKNTQYEGAFKTQEGKNVILLEREIDSFTHQNHSILMC